MYNVYVADQNFVILKSYYMYNDKNRPWPYFVFINCYLVIKVSGDFENKYFIIVTFFIRREFFDPDPFFSYLIYK